MAPVGTSHLEAKEQWWSVALIKEIRFSHNELDGFGRGALDSVSESLEILLLDHNSFLLFPDEICYFPTLRKLMLNNNHIEIIPDSFSQSMQLLTVCTLAQNSIKELPRDLTSMESLKLLDVSGNALESLHSKLPIGLEKLILSKNYIAFIEDDLLENHRHLTVLDLANNNLSSLPPSISALVSLKLLDVRYNSLAHGIGLPVHVDQVLLGFNKLVSIHEFHLERLQELSVLDIRDNKITDIPEEAYLCKSLKMLECSNNDLTVLPTFLGYMPALQALSVHGNALRGFRHSVLDSGAESLKAYLRTRGVAPDEASENKAGDQSANALDNLLLRDSLAAFRHSGIFKISKHVLTPEEFNVAVHEIMASDTKCFELQLCAVGSIQVPQMVPTLTLLLKLDLSENMIQAFDVSILYPLQSLQRLNLSSNSMHSFGSQDQRCVLSKLESLDLHQNLLENIPHVIPWAFPNLKELHLGFNNIRSDQQSLNECTNLEYLDLSNNKISDFPVGVWGMQHLYYLNMENNELSSIPCEIALLPKMKSLLISGNPQRSIRPHIIAEGSSRLLEYLKSRCPNQIPETQNEAALGSTAFIADDSISFMDMERLENSIQEMQLQLENDFSMSTSTRQVLKRQIQRDRATLLQISQSVIINK